MKKIGRYLTSKVVPIMNEEGNICALHQRIKDVFQNEDEYEIIFVDDGSTDNTLESIKILAASEKSVKFISFSRNFGHQNALRAGLDYASGDCVISMDGDLQHPPELIPDMIHKWLEGYDIVYTIRKDVNEKSLFKRKTSQYFYRLINQLSDTEIEQGSADFRLIDKKVVNVLRNFRENTMFYRGIIRWLGFKQFAIEYRPELRTWGRTKYSLNKMFRFAILGITSFSIRPLHLSTLLGSVIASLSIIYGFYAIIMKLFSNQTIQGWTSMIIIVSFLGGVQLLILGIIGEYLGKLFIESKQRPSYIIREISDNLNL